MTYAIIERKVKRGRLEFRDGEIVAIVPRGKSHMAEIMVQKHQGWILRNLQKYQVLQETAKTVELSDRSPKQLAVLIDDCIEKASVLLQKKPRQVSYRQMKRRWGSCSISGDLVFNKRLAFVPDYLVWYIVFHEMCHLLVHAHNKQFNNLMRTQFSDVRALRQALHTYAFVIDERS